MARQLPRLATDYGAVVDRCQGLITAVDGALAASTPNWTITRAELAYEAAFLRVFADWEMLVEEVLIRLMTGYDHGTPNSTFVPGFTKAATIADARASLYGGAQYVMWYDPTKVLTRVTKRMQTSHLESVISSSQLWLENMAHVRHRIAHRSEDARLKFDTTTMAISGRRFPASSAGKFLRYRPGGSARNLDSILLNFKNLAAQLAP